MVTGSERRLFRRISGRERRDAPLTALVT
jgi:hypothetical protein